MNREEYLNELSKYLNKLPKEDYDDAMNHFEECFDDVGSSGETDLIKELGNPRNVATELLSNLIIDSEEKNEIVTVEKKKGSFWKVFLISILVILAAPIGVPLTIALIAVVFSIFLTIGAVVISLVLVGVTGLILSFKTLFVGVVSIGTSVPAALILIGVSLVSIALTVLLVIGIYYFILLMIYCLKKIVSYVSNKRRAA